MKKIIVFIISVFVSYAAFSQASYNEKNILKSALTINTSASAFIKKGSRDVKNKNFADAISNFTKALELESGNADALVYRGLSKYNINDIEGAIKDFNKALEIEPEYAEAYYLRGIIKDSLNYNYDACIDWNKAVDLGMKEAGELINAFCK